MPDGQPIRMTAVDSTSPDAGMGLPKEERVLLCSFFLHARVGHVRPSQQTVEITSLRRPGQFMMGHKKQAPRQTLVTLSIRRPNLFHGTASVTTSRTVSSPTACWVHMTMSIHSGGMSFPADSTTAATNRRPQSPTYHRPERRCRPTP